MSQPPQSPYICDGCSEIIPPQKARIHCETCVQHNICANCYVVGVYTGQHVDEHSITLLDHSGYLPRSVPRRQFGAGREASASGAGTPPPVPQDYAFPPGAVQQQSQQAYTADPPAVQQRQPQPYSSSQAIPQQSRQQQGYSPSPQAFPPPPGVQRQQTYSPPPGAREKQTYPPLPPRVQQQSYQHHQTASSPPQASAPKSPQPPSANQSRWQPLFSGSSASPILVAFLQAVFALIDTDKDGLLTPEQYTSFLEVQNYRLNEHVWKKNHKDLPGYTADDVADYELRVCYENFSIEHKMVPRPNAKKAPTVMSSIMDQVNLDASFKKIMLDSAENSQKTFSDGMMPMITLRGFIDITVIETLSEPSPGWLRINRIAQHYNIWREMGDVPRAMLPESPPPELMSRIAIIQQQAAARAQTLINTAQMEAQMQAQTNENISRLFDPPGTRYYYR